ncbi:LPS assembly lipoprotein LptE [Stigmatella sp. ncwal1]|uniref:LPS assembly lipoprotein LptE n=1 Tax=Stigmatella ashevillensis TaxID=2995309 RepID=A0ABT5D5X2_9BACT|nr:LPS assembly lipoprotein LptE [Stigmatella ashevillena]MDC0708966.1 LPS assembly lipoprotein LptE [Stigmatella ashevillena]
MARVRVVAWGLLATGLGCGYRFVPRDSTLPQGLRSVCAPMFLNQTPEPGLETLFTQSFRQELVRSGTLGASGACEGSVEGTVTSVNSFPTIVTEPMVENGVVTRPSQLASYRASAEARLRLLKDGQVIAETSVAGTEDYLPGSGDVLEAEANRLAALRRLSETLMHEGYERLAQNW